jgi:hypothetical protein
LFLEAVLFPRVLVGYPVLRELMYDLSVGLRAIYSSREGYLTGQDELFDVGTGGKGQKAGFQEALWQYEQ